MALLVLIGSLLVALAISAPLQRPISRAPSWPWLKPSGSSPSTEGLQGACAAAAGPERNRTLDRCLQPIARQHRGTRHCIASHQRFVEDRNFTERRWGGRKLQDRSRRDWRCCSRSPVPPASVRICKASSRLSSVAWKTACPSISAVSAMYETGCQTSLMVTQVGVRSEAVAMELAMTNQARVEIDQNGSVQLRERQARIRSRTSAIPLFAFPQRRSRAAGSAFIRCRPAHGGEPGLWRAALPPGGRPMLSAAANANFSGNSANTSPSPRIRRNFTRRCKRHTTTCARPSRR